MILIESEYRLNRRDTLTHMVLPFEIKNEFDSINIRFSYQPRLVPKEVAKPLIEACIDKYLDINRYSIEKIEEYKSKTDIENLITVTLLYEGEYIGSWHNKSNEQNITISSESSSLGFKKTPIKIGNWELKLNFHSVNSDVRANLIVEARSKSEVSK